MNKRKLFYRGLYLIFFILIVNFLANKFYWYSSIWFFDMPMHFLGGAWVALAYFYIFPFKEKNITTSCILRVLCAVFLVGLGWEFFEFFVDNGIAHNIFNLLDTSSDLFFDLSGGILALLYFSKRIMFLSADKVE